MLDLIKKAAERFKNSEGIIRIVTHYDTDGITAGAIIATAMKRLDRQFKISVISQLDRKNLEALKKEGNKITFLLDLGAQYLEEINSFENEVFVLDHHEIKETVLSENITFINPHLTADEEIPASVISYLFAKELDVNNADLASLAVLGMVGDFAEQDLGKIGNSVVNDAKNVTVRKNLLLFPSTRPLNKALEFSSIYIPGVTGSAIGSLNLIREAGIKIRENSQYKTLLDLTEDELSRLITLITLKRAHSENLIGKIYLIKFLNHLEDARELSSLINACGRLGHADIAVAFCMGCKKAKSNAETLYSSYKHQLIAGLNWISLNEKIEGEGYVIINAESSIKDSIIGTLISILASSFIYPENTVIVGMARTEDKRIKISARAVGHNSDLNLKKLLENPINIVGGEYGGHKRASGGFIPVSKEKTFIELLQKELRVSQLQIKV